MIKFKITPERFNEACNVIEYLNVTAKIKETVIRVAPRFIVDKAGEYIVQVTLDDDGDIVSYDNVQPAFALMMQITPRRLEKLIDEFAEAARNIVNPPNGGG